MIEDRVVCHCFDVRYSDIRKAMSEGALTLEAIQEKTEAGTACGGCIEEIEEILETACNCYGVSVEEVRQSVQQGASSVTEVTKATKAGAACGKCQTIVGHIIADSKK
ncbi:MAG: (2Fe-2S)-binding protein [Bacteroidales bacterium]